jgi:hypothetical protein
MNLSYLIFFLVKERKKEFKSSLASSLRATFSRE